MRTHIVLLDRFDAKTGRISGKTDTFKNAEVKFPEGPVANPEELLGRYVKVRIEKATFKTLSGSFQGMTTIDEFASESGNAPFI
jgi:hypothetical protein